MVKSALYTFVRPDPSEPNPELLAVSPLALRTLGLAPSEASTSTFLALVSGNPSGFESEVYPWAQCYGGWQFGQWAGQLGDGRAISLFEATNPDTGERFELQLKGAGQTPYSRFADGRAVLRSSIREFVASEYLHAIGIPTTRALSLTLLPSNRAIRERVEPCAIVCRFAQSWVRFGTFDLLRWRGDRKNLRVLADYVRTEVLKLGEEIKDGSGNRYEETYREIARRNARTVAKWQAYGFMNGVLNTDNTSVLGLSLDFGPFSFMDVSIRSAPSP
jgi:serine/tyrosine/threonine adenylyltransferase